MWRRSNPEPVKELEATELGEECAAFLAGGSRDYLEARGRPIPAWAWVNRLTHGDQAAIEYAAAMHHSDDTPDALIAEIAAAALARLAGGATLEALQRITLVPLELALAASAGPAPASSSELARALASALTNRLSPIETRRPGQ